jgi:hypothetical protein
MLLCVWGSPPRNFFVQILRSSVPQAFLIAACQPPRPTLSAAMASNSFNNNNAKADLAYARQMLHGGVVPSFLEMLQKPAYAFRRVPHNSCRAVAYQFCAAVLPTPI